MFSSEKLEAMSNFDIRAIDPCSLVDINTVKVDRSLPQLERIESILSQIRNPYCFLSGDTPVRVRFVGNEKNLAQSLINYFSSLKE